MTISVAQDISNTLARWRKKSCTQVFNGVAYIRTYNPARDWDMRLELPLQDAVQPPALLEDAFALKNISQAYVMPKGLESRDVEAYALLLSHAVVRGEMTQEQRTKKLSRTFNRLAMDNKPLRALRFDKKDPKKLFDAVLGATSGFNTNDIQHFLDGNYGYISERNPKWNKLQKNISRHLGINGLGWVPSMKTLHKIKRQVITRKPEPYRGSLR